jgi:hypothetical protein
LDGQWLFDAEGVVQDSERGGGLGYLDRVVDVADDGPAGGLGEVGGAFEDERGREVFGYGLDLGAGGAGEDAVSMRGKVGSVFVAGVSFRYLREAQIAYVRAVAALVARAEFQGLFPINGDFESAVWQDLVCKRLQALGHTLLQFLVVQAEVQGVCNSGYRFGDVLMNIVRLRTILFHQSSRVSHLARVLDKVASDKLSLPLLAVAESGIV